MPHEIAILGLYFPPLFPAALTAVIVALITGWVFNRFHLTRFIWHPPLFFCALTVFLTTVIGTVLIPV